MFIFVGLKSWPAGWWNQLFDRRGTRFLRFSLPPMHHEDAQPPALRHAWHIICFESGLTSSFRPGMVVHDLSLCRILLSSPSFPHAASCMASHRLK